MIQSPVLVLNASYEPINICAARRAITLLIKGVAKVEESWDLLVHKNFKLPSVIRLNNYRRVPVQRQLVSRRNIFIRDHFMCQYCGEKFQSSNLTLDHVMPRSRGGWESWENLVTACHACNHQKADRTPEEAGMPLLRRPRPLTLYTHRLASGSEDPRWDRYLFQ